MCRKLALAATALMLAEVLAAAPAQAAWGLKSTPPAQAANAAQSAQTSAKAAPNPKATPQERQAAERLEPLARAAFWAAQVSADSKDAEAGVKLAAALRALARYPEAFQAAQKVLVYQPKNVEALLETARVAIAEGQGFYAVDPTRKAEVLAPRDWRIPSLQGVALEQSERPVEALAAHRRALALAPDNAVVLSNLAMFYAAQGDKAQAEVLLRKAVALPGAGLQVRQNLAIVLGFQGKLAEAEQLQREDLPPQMAANNLAYLKAAAEAAPTR
jgi:Flp pilus assembly protein TadD